MPDPAILPLALTAAGAGALSAGGVLAYSVFAPRCQFWAPVIRSIPQREAVALTFEDGPHPEFTPHLLDILKQHNVPATFFVIGRLAREHPALIRRIAEEGHVLGNHTWDHPRFSFTSSLAFWRQQVCDTQQILADLTGQPPVLFRPPGGIKHWHIATAAREQRLVFVDCSILALMRHASAAQNGQRLLKRITGHDILLLRDAPTPAAAGNPERPARMITALPDVLAGVSQRGLKIVSLVDALLSGAAAKEAAAIQRRANMAAS